MGSGIQKKIKKSAIERISGVEQAVAETVSAVNRSFGLISQRFQEMDDWKEGVLRALGLTADAVNDAIKANRLDRVTAQVNAAKAALEAGVTNGDIVETDTVTANSLIVGRELNNDGTEIPPGRAQLLVSTLSQAIQEQLLGKGVGTVATITPEAKIEVTQIFNLVEKETPAAEADADFDDSDQFDDTDNH
jgi:hypothetical protein